MQFTNPYFKTAQEKKIDELVPIVEGILKEGVRKVYNLSQLRAALPVQYQGDFSRTDAIQVLLALGIGGDFEGGS